MRTKNSRRAVLAIDSSTSAIADFNLAAEGEGTALALHYSYTPNRLGRVAKGTTDKQMRKGISGLAEDLKHESERIAAN